MIRFINPHEDVSLCRSGHYYSFQINRYFSGHGSIPRGSGIHPTCSQKAPNYHSHKESTEVRPHSHPCSRHSSTAAAHPAVCHRYLPQSSLHQGSAGLAATTFVTDATGASPTMSIPAANIACHCCLQEPLLLQLPTASVTIIVAVATVHHRCRSITATENLCKQNNDSHAFPPPSFAVAVHQSCPVHCICLPPP